MSKYLCPQCGRASKLPDFCCGKSMVGRGSYVCKGCGNVGKEAGKCCEQDMVQM